MFDVVPPARPRRSASAPRRRPLKRRRVAASATPQSPGPRVVSLQWQLPARLRRPIRQELARERHKQQQEQSIVAFERRPIYSQVPDTHPTYGRPKTVPQNQGAEHHTADVYYHSRPSLAVQLPPYRGRALPPKEKIAPPTPIARRIQPAAPAPVPTPATPAKRPQAGRAAALASLEADVRDVPYRWTQALESKPKNSTLFVNEAQQLLAPIKQPKRRFTLPLHFSVFPWRKKNVVDSGGNPAKKKR